MNTLTDFAFHRLHFALAHPISSAIGLVLVVGLYTALARYTRND